MSDIRDLLDSTAPEGPELTPADRVAAVTGRARAVTRRNRLLVSAAAVAVVGALGLTVPLVTGDDEGTAPIGGDDPASVEDVAPVECPAEPVDVGPGLPADALPDGASSARLCPARSGTASGGPDDLPEEPLVDDVDALTGAIRDLPPYALEPRCATLMPVVAPWSLVVGYPDGSTVTIGTTTRTCAAVTVEGVDRSAEQVLGLFPGSPKP